MTETLEETQHRYFVGLTKSGAAADARELANLSLAAMKSRFTRQRAPDGTGVVRVAIADETFLPDAARIQLSRLCAAKHNDALAAAAALALERARVTPHPFDFFRLEEFTVRFAERLGRTARDWARLVRPQKMEQAEPEGLVTEDTFAAAGRTGKLAFLGAMLRQEPARARAFLAQQFPAESAALRGDFLDLLAPVVTESDLALLQAVAGDKAKSVRDKAEALLARVPGTEPHKARLARVPDYLKVKSALVTRKKSLSIAGLAAPVGPKLAELVGGLTLKDISGALELSVDVFVAAAAETEGLSDIVLRRVVAERRFDLLSHFDDVFREGSWLVAQVLREALADATEENRDRLIRLCILPAAWKNIPPAPVLEQLGAALGGPLPHAQGEALLNAPAFHTLIQQEATPLVTGQLEALAPLLPRTCSQKFIVLANARAPRAVLYHQFLLSLPEQGSS
ncbi:MAG TPA: DUF5691 domain-containing protein [Rhizomicrobium sp.]|nr:DUF5691 domain-containing protein [Rhizomicrobium sp.]